MPDTKIKFGGLWSNEAKNGTTYLIGNFGDAKILVFPNSFKREPKHPDFIVYFASREKKLADGPEPEQYPDGDTPF